MPTETNLIALIYPPPPKDWYDDAAVDQQNEASLVFCETASPYVRKCELCGGEGEYESETGPKGCQLCSSRLYSVTTRDGTPADLDWGDVVVIDLENKELVVARRYPGGFDARKDETPLDRFMFVYTACLDACVRVYPQKYGYGPEKVEEVASRIRTSIEQKLFSATSLATQLACRCLDIRQSASSLWEYTTQKGG